GPDAPQSNHSDLRVVSVFVGVGDDFISPLCGVLHIAIPTLCFNYQVESWKAEEKVGNDAIGVSGAFRVPVWPWMYQQWFSGAFWQGTGAAGVPQNLPNHLRGEVQ